jgi:cytochrome c oxidase subunit I+III
MFTTGLPGISLGLFSAASEAVAIPTGVQIFCFLATLAAGRLTRSGPMLYAFGSLVIFVLGGLTGVMVAIAPFGFQAHDTFFVVAHFHYVLIGGAPFPILAGCYYFFPLVNGKKLCDTLGKIAFRIAFIGFNVAFLPMHLTGLRGMPRRVFAFLEGLGFDALNFVSTIGAFILVAGLVVVF